MNYPNGTLFVVATPLGNLEDITIRALKVLRKVDSIACEDTRQSKKLLSHFRIKKNVVSLHSYNENKKVEKIILMLKQEKSVAYITDAGTPGISDPGTSLVAAARKNGIGTIPIPGPTAATALMSISSFGGKGFRFVGFLTPKKAKRKKQLKQLLENEVPFILYESPYRIQKTLHDIKEIDNTRQILIGREMTKMHEEYLENNAEELIRYLEEKNSIKGEFTILVESKKNR